MNREKVDCHWREQDIEGREERVRKIGIGERKRSKREGEVNGLIIIIHVFYLLLEPA